MAYKHSLSSFLPGASCYHESTMQLRLILLLLLPSWLSFSVVVGAAALLVGGANWTYFTYNPGIFDFFYGPRGVITTLEQSPNALAAVQRGVAENPILYGLGIVVIAAIVAIGIFLLVRVLENGMGAIRHLSHEAVESRHEAYHRAFLRFVVAMLWADYAVFSGVVAVPFCLLLSRISAENLLTTQGLVMSVSSTFLLALVFHGHVIFVRVFCLRPRVFGGEAAIEAATLGRLK